MEIFPIDPGNYSVDGGQFVNFEAGVTLSVRECVDKSGFIGKLIDAFTGDLIRNFFGSNVESVANAAGTHVEKFNIYKVIAR
jgi:hypothetical protein